VCDAPSLIAPARVYDAETKIASRICFWIVDTVGHLVSVELLAALRGANRAV
jgi:hypothetical protein